MRPLQRPSVLVAGAILAILLFSSGAQAEDEEASAEALARQSYELANSDMVYQQEIYKALYHQNVQMIQLLKEIRDEMHMINVRDAKEKTA